MARSTSLLGDLKHALEASPQPVYLLSARRVILYANPACAQWLGVPREQLSHVRCDYHSQSSATSPAAALVAGLCPPPAAFGQPFYMAEVFASPPGNLPPRRRAAGFTALTLPDDEGVGLLAVVAGEDATADVTPATPAALELAAPAELHVLLRWLRQWHASRPALERWVGEEPSVRRVREQFAAAVASRARVAIIGPRGAGGAELARGIHYRAKGESTGPCATVDGSVVDAESLQTAVTSLARSRTMGAAAAPAALIVLSADQLSSAAQHELAGFLQLPSFDVRTLVTADRSLVELAGAGKFDRGLALALSTLVIELPCLTQRRSDFPLIVQSLIEEFNAQGGKQIGGAAAEALDRLALYSWPGDMEQLASAVHEACAAAATTELQAADLPHFVSAAAAAALRPRKRDESFALDQILAAVEREVLCRALRRAKQNKAKAARLLRISRPRLLRRMEQLGLVERTAETIDFVPEDSDTP